eukprot:569946-Alexandrium_andersonii.AAC.1
MSNPERRHLSEEGAEAFKRLKTASPDDCLNALQELLVNNFRQMFEEFDKRQNHVLDTIRDLGKKTEELG